MIESLGKCKITQHMTLGEFIDDIHRYATTSKASEAERLDAVCMALNGLKLGLQLMADANVIRLMDQPSDIVPHLEDIGAKNC